MLGRVVFAGLFAAALATAASVVEPATANRERKVITGQMQKLSEHLKTLAIPIDADQGSQMVVVTSEGTVIPIVKDERSRGFFMDKRLQNRRVELHVYQYDGLPFVRIINAFGLKGSKRYHIDYWCDICSIATFEPGPCPCCQDEIELRETLQASAPNASK